MINEFKNHEDLGLCYCRSYRLNDKSENLGIHQWGEDIDPYIWEKNKYFEKQEYVQKYLRFRNTIPNVSAVLFKKEILHIDSEILRFKFCGDWMLYIHIAENHPVSYVSKPLNYFRRYNTSATFINASLKKEKLRISEYLQIINYANKHTDKKLSEDINKYEWICNHWIGNSIIKNNNKIGYYFPNIPFILKLSFYKLILTKILKSIFLINK
jgi:hypothetical protein